MKSKSLYFSLTLLAVLIISSGFAVVATKSMLVKAAKIQQQDSPDFFMHDIVFTQMDKTGAVQNHLQAAAINHYTTSDSYIFEGPHLEMVDKDKNIWHISAGKGSSKDGADAVYLWDGVVITQQIKAQNGLAAEDIKINTSDAVIKPEQNLATTGKAITIAQGKSIVHAVGAEVNFNTSTVKLLSQVQGQYAASHANTINGK